MQTVGTRLDARKAYRGTNGRRWMQRGCDGRSRKQALQRRPPPTIAPVTCSISGLSLSMTAKSTPRPLSVEKILKLVLSSRAVISTTMLCFST